MPPPPPEPPLSYTTHPSVSPDLQAIPVSEWLVREDYRPCVGVAVLHHGPELRVLLVQRAPEEALPNVWEIPGGSAEPSEPNLVTSATRELYEETGLRATAVVAMLGMYTWTDTDPSGEPIRRRDGSISRWKKWSFVAEVEGGSEDETPKVVLDPAEHQAYVWASESEVLADKSGDVDLVWTSADQKTDVARSFEIAKSVAARAA
ncbi:NUDIX hydrolase domain-like protein [Plectosphaerella cucumerina]|uniref:NUDIX hydrolase domain-like protein n=1 Tax=Plectosphaerella cucumerina TaxID=40658 RepID=A0A8K0TCR8_9PEZI|nr:NUDIX hydrolase domain-like protein [Plectosphaerella cucumerina]